VAAGLWGYYYASRPVMIAIQSAPGVLREIVAPQTHRDHGEQCEHPLEPILVEDILVPPPPTLDPVGESETDHRIERKPGMTIAPRPDEDGKTQFMPYADEDEPIDCSAQLRLLRNLEEALTGLKLLERIEGPDPAAQDEPEDKDVNPAQTEQEPEPMRQPPPAMEHYHQQHCPYPGPCPYPYNRRP
jgi:hypothetical protein